MIAQRQSHRTWCHRERIRSVSQLSCSSRKVAELMKFRPLWTRVKLSHRVTSDISPLGSPPINSPHPPTIWAGCSTEDSEHPTRENPRDNQSPRAELSKSLRLRV